MMSKHFKLMGAMNDRLMKSRFTLSKETFGNCFGLARSSLDLIASPVKTALKV
jgi:hypothetical protein